MAPEAFDWDEGNTEKNWNKHRVNAKECEQIFLNIPLVTLQDTKHSDRENRFILLGKTNQGRLLHVVCTMRGKSIRVISARDQNKKERRRYEQEKK